MSETQEHGDVRETHCLTIIHVLLPQPWALGSLLLSLAAQLGNNVKILLWDEQSTKHAFSPGLHASVKAQMQQLA